MERTLVALDLETTGLTPRLDRIIEVGAVRFRGAEVLGRFQSLVRPEVTIPAAVQQLTGISDSDVEFAPEVEQVMGQLVEFVGDSGVVAHSGNFDLSFLRDGERVDTAYELFDTLDLARILLPMSPSHSLPHLSRQLGLVHPRPHRALEDAEAAQQLFRYLWDFTRSLPSELLDRMLEVTLGWSHPLRDFLEEAQGAGPNGQVSLRPPPPPAQAVPRTGEPLTDPEAIRDLLGPDGPMAAGLEDYELREAQQQMALAVAQLFHRGGRLMVEAGPGTGKSLAYLVPAVHHAVAAGERVVIATNTITLQEQLFAKDIPFMRSWLAFDFKAALLKGRANYVSLRRWNRYLNAPSRRADGSWFPEEVKFKLRMLVWLAQSPHGDRSEIKLNGLDDLFWLRAASTADDCLAAHCENYKTQSCFYWNSRRAAADADLIVTNHALLLADALGSGSVLPDYQHVVIDEAHQLEEAAVDTLTVLVGEEELLESLEGTLTWYRAACGPLDAGLKESSQRLKRDLSDLFEQLRSVIKQLQPEAGTRSSRDENVLLDGGTRALPELAAAVRKAADTVRSARDLASSLQTGGTQLELEPNPRAERELELFLGQLAVRARLLEEALQQPRPDRLYWLGIERRSSRAVVQAAPIHAGQVLQQRALAEKETVVFTSASLAVADTFDYFKRGVGLSQASTYEMILPSPFDYLSQALLCLPTDLLDLNDPLFIDQTADTVAGIARLLSGRTLVLFTAHQQLREVTARLRTLMAQQGIGVLAQNLDGTRRQLLQQFREDPRAILLGTSSFWEGIDVPGDALSCVVIVRLPFRVPTDPQQLARSAGLMDPFAELVLPEAVLRLKQGFGRLIRRQTDRGAVVLLDHRVANRTYGRAFLDALPRAAVHLGRSEEVAPAIGQWLRPGASPHAGGAGRATPASETFSA